MRRSIILHSVVNIILVGVASVHVIYYWKEGKIGLVEYALIAVTLVLVGSGIVMAVVRLRTARRIVVHYSIR